MDTLNILLDTDIGPDCDDAGALGLLHILSRKRKLNILAMTHCTSSPYGCGCIDAINHAFDKKDIPIGTLKKSGFLDMPDYYQYNKFISEHYPNRFTKAMAPASALGVLKKALLKAEDSSVVVVAIGPLTNLADLVNDPQGRILIKEKVKLLISMAGCFEEPNEKFPYAEWNVEMDIKAAQDVFEKWGSDIVLAPFETGIDIITGSSWGTMSKEHPVRKAYALHSPNGRPSWDLTAIFYAVMGSEPHFSVSPAGDIVIKDDGKSEFTQNSNGRFKYLKISKSTHATAIADKIDSLWED